MPNGRKLSIDQATAMIKKFESYESAHGTPVNDLAIGQKIDLTVLNDFLAAIAAHPQKDNIDAVRIYLARSKRAGDDTREHYDVVLVPVLKVDAAGQDLDLHKVYDREEKFTALPTLVGNSLPCPNVCPRLVGFYC